MTYQAAGKLNLQQHDTNEKKAILILRILESLWNGGHGQNLFVILYKEQ